MQELFPKSHIPELSQDPRAEGRTPGFWSAGPRENTDTHLRSFPRRADVRGGKEEGLPMSPSETEAELPSVRQAQGAD